MARLTRPRLHAALPRERLFALLDAQRKYPLIWVTAPPGAGKTTLVASYCEARKIPSLWYQVDSGDRDPATFFYYLRLAALATVEKKRAKLPLLTSAYSSDLGDFIRRWFRELFGLLPRDAMLVLDNYQDAPADSAFPALIVAAAAEVPETLTVVIISRSEPPLEFARLIAEQKLVTLDWNELRLTLEETTAIASIKHPLREDMLRCLHEQCGGWAAGVVLMLERFRQTGTMNRIAGGEAMETIFAYFAEQIFNQTSAQNQQALIRTALLPRMTPEQAELISGDADAGKLLDQLYRRHLFTDRRLGPELTYQYHALFREFLLAKARQMLTEQQLDTLRRHAAELLDFAEQPDAAIELLREAGDWAAIAKTTLKWAKSFIEQGRHNLLNSWFELLAPSLFGESPWLCYWRGFALMPVQPSATVKWCERAFALFRRNGDRAGLLLSWARIIQAIRFDPRCDLKQMDAWIAVADQLLAEHSGFPSEEVEYQFVYGMYVALQHRMPWHPRHNAWRDRAIALGLSSTDSANRAYLAYLAVSFETQRGHLVQAKLVLDAVSRVKNLSALTQAFSYVGRIQLEIELGETDAALCTMEAGLENANESGIHVWDMFLRWHGGRAALLRGDIALAQRLQAQIAAHADIMSSVPGYFYHYLSALIALLQRSLPTAALHAEKALALNLTSGWLVAEARCRLLLSRVLLEMGSLGDAREQLATMKALATRLDYPALLSQALLQEALLAFAEGDETAGLDALKSGLKFAQELEIKQTLWFCPADGSRLCSRAMQTGITPYFVKEVIRCRTVIPETPDIENWPWPVQLLTFGRFSLIRDGKPVEFHHKAPKKPLALLKAIVAFGGKAIPEEQLAAALWANEEGDAAHQLFTAVVHRVRRLLEYDEVIKIKEGRVSLNPRLCWVDVWAFQRLLGQAEQAARSGDLDRQCQVIDRALRLYRGGFLAADTEESWAMAMHERLRSLFIRNLATLGQHLQTAGRHEEALACYLRGTEADPLAEEFYQGQMHCYLKVGRHAEGLAVYRRLRQILSVTLGIAPSAPSEALHRSLLG
ncbi:MAG: BTAD domain-containing putative transcriptional regulator [Burkholderiales bacterium]